MSDKHNADLLAHVRRLSPEGYRKLARFMRLHEAINAILDDDYNFTMAEVIDLLTSQCLINADAVSDDPGDVAQKESWTRAYDQMHRLQSWLEKEKL